MGVSTVIIAALTATIVGASALPDRFIIAADGDSRVTFEVEAAFHQVVGTSRSPEGRFTVSLDAPGDVKGWVRVAVASLSTGYPERDEALRRPEFLDAERHPTIEFRVTGAEFPDGRQIAPDRILEGVARGTLTLKGKRKAVEVPIRVGWSRGQGDSASPRLHLQTRFVVKLSDFGIGPASPDILVSDEAAVAADLYASRR